jgi:hypothetical protein
MRSDLVFDAVAHIQNRYLLVRLTSKTTRIFHRPDLRLEETANDALRLFCHTNPQETQSLDSLPKPRMKDSHSKNRPTEDQRLHRSEAISTGWVPSVELIT